MQHKKFEQLFSDAQALYILMNESEKLCDWCHPIAYHTNNISNMNWAPKWIWNFISDIIYRMYEKHTEDFSDILPYVIEKIRYEDPDNFVVNMDNFFRWIIPIARNRYIV